MRKARGAAYAALLAFLLALLSPAAAFAHAVLVASEPSDGAMLAAPPERMTLTFNEAVSPLVLRLLGPDGAAQTVEVMQDGDTLSILPGGPLKNGTHLLSWRVVSADGHPVGGTVMFSVGHASETGPSQPATERLAGIAAWAARVAIYVAMFVGVGGTFFVFWFGGRPLYAAERMLYALLLAGLVALPLSLGFQGADLLGVPLAHLIDSAIWQAGLRSAYAVTAAIAFASCFAAQFAFAASSTRVARLASAAAFAGVGLALAASGHASAAEPQWLMRAAVFVHALGVAFWIGAFVPLAGFLLARTHGAHTALRRFSRAAPFAVAALIASGAALAFVQVGEVSALWQTDYGRLLLVKLALLAVLFSIALHNRFVLTGRVLAEEPAGRRTLVRMMAVEIALALAIFSVTAAWRFTPPPRALAARDTMPATVHMHALKAMADLRFDPGRTGPVTASILIMTGEFGLLDAREVLLVLTNRSAGIEPIRRAAQRDADGVWRVHGLTVPMPGQWTARVDILITDFEKITLEETVEFRR